MEPQGRYMADEIKKAFKRSGMTIYRLAKNSGVSQPVVSRFVNDRRGITLTTASKLATALGRELKPRSPETSHGKE